MTSPQKEADPPAIAQHRFVKVLGSGGFADVYLYEREGIKLEVAVKVLRAQTLTPAMRMRFEEEAAVMARLSHPHIASVMASGQADDGRPYIIMKYFSGANLGIRARRELFSVADVLRMGIQLSAAVETAHRAGILHCDIKPANVLTDQYGDIGLTDFGLASRGDQSAVESQGVSVPWSPTEVLYATADADERSDVFSLSATLWHLLAGRSPFEIPGGDNRQAALMARIRAGDITPMERADVPESLLRSLKWGMAANAAARPDSALAFARSLQSVEQELKLAPTRVVLPQDVAPRASDTGDDDERTNPRGPLKIAPDIPVVTGSAGVVPRPRRDAGLADGPQVSFVPPPPSAQPVHPPQQSARAQPSAFSGAERPRGPIPAPPGADETVVRASSVSADANPDSAVSNRFPRKLLMIVLVAVVAGIALGGWTLSHGSKPMPHGTAAIGKPGEQKVIIVPAPRLPSIAAKAAGRYKVRFSWTWNKHAGDASRYQLTINGKKEPTRTTQGSSLTAPVHRRDCLAVTIYQRSGNPPSPTAEKCYP